MPFVDPVHSARGRLAYSSRTDIVQHDPNAVSNARRELTAAKLERSVREALAAAPPLTAEAAPRNTCSTHTALGDSPVQSGVGFARNLRRLQDLLEPDAVKVAHPILGYPWSASRRLPALPSMTAVQLRDEGPGALGSHQRFALGQQVDLLRAKDRDVIPRRGPARATPSRVVAGSGNPGGRPDPRSEISR